MRILAFCLALTCFVVGSAGLAKARADFPESATIGFIPGDDLEWLKKNGVELAKALQVKLKVPINIFISKNYDGLVQAMKDKQVDFAFFSALTFVEAEKEAGAKPLLKKVWDGPFYYSTVITTKKTGITSIEGLKGKRFGWVDEKSASGHLYPLVMMKKRGIDPEPFFKEAKYYGQHEAALKALFSGEADAVAVYSNDAKGKSGAWDKFTPEEKKSIRVLWVSDPIPNDPFCVRQDFYDSYPRFTHEMMFSLIDFRDEPPEKNLLKKLYGINDMVPVTSRQYDPVRDLVKFLNAEEKH